eukprot:s169_g19.t1
MIQEHHKKVEQEALQSHLRQKEPTGDGSSSGHGYIGGEHVDRGDSENIREVEPWSELDDLLFRAIEERDAASVQLLVECRVDPEKPSNEENSHISAVHLTAEIGWVDGMKYLCKVKADVNLAPKKCSSPFWVALYDSDWDILQALIRSRANTNDFNSEGVTPLIHMTSHSEAVDDFYSMQILNILLKGKADPNKPDEDGFTALHYAVKYGHQQMSCLLIKNKADINFRNRQFNEHNRHAGKTALSLAVEQADVDMVGTLLNYDADVQTALEPTSTSWILHNLIGQRYVQVRQMLMYKQNYYITGAVSFPTGGRKDLLVSGDPEALQRDLLRTASMPGSDATGRLKSLLACVELSCTDFRGRSALWKASFCGDIDKVEWLVREGADLRQTDLLSGASALQVAAQQGHNQVVQFLCEKRANLAQRDKYQVSPLYVASQFGHEDVVRFLVHHRAEVNHTTVDGATPLHIAVQQGQATVVKILLGMRADVHLVLPNGFTPLCIAVLNQRPEIVAMLIEASVEVNKAIKDPVDEMQKPPLVIAAACGHTDVVRMLARSRADLEQADPSGDTAMEVAKKAGHEAVVRVLKGTEPLDIEPAPPRAPTPGLDADAGTEEPAPAEDDNTAGCGRPICRHYIRNECNRRNCRYCHGPHCRFCRAQEVSMQGDRAWPAARGPMPTHADRADFYFRGHNR